MTRSTLAKTLLFFSLIDGARALAADSAVPRLECGDYRVSGVLRQNSLGQFVLVVREGTTAAHELILLGGDVAGKLRALNSGVALDVYVPRLIRSNASPFVFAQGGLTPSSGLDEAPKLLKPAACGLKDRFRGA
jgi:hypothetical protein